MPGKIISVGPRDKIPDGFTLVDVTSRSAEPMYKALSPFYLPAGRLYGDYSAKNVENAWQYAKVYANYDDNSKPKPEYFDWAQNGWNKTYADRFPMGKGTRPVYSWWDGEALDYISARKKIYVPLYERTAIKTAGYENLRQRLINSENIAVSCFDSYNYEDDFEKTLNDPRRILGHAMVLANMLTADLS